MSWFCLTKIPIYVSYQEEWLSYPVRIHWRKVFSLPSENKCWCFPVCGWNCFYFPFSKIAPPLNLNLYLYSCVYCCNLFQFMCASVSLFSWNLLLHLSICIFLPPILTSDVSSETWGKVFMKLSNWDWILWNLTLALHCCKTQV